MLVLAGENMFNPSLYGFVQFNLGKAPLYKWSIKVNYRYNTTEKNELFNTYRYEPRTLSIQKKEHRRLFNLSYNYKTQEMLIKYTFDAFKDDPLILRKKQDILKLEGRFQKSAKERL